ncbi:MAG TPA: hypothetical protein VHQ69_05930 [Methylomirabilota bacterium]|nr:hypothetical protein [Methylomirabilota bacterium]
MEIEPIANAVPLDAWGGWVGEGLGPLVVRRTGRWAGRGAPPCPDGTANLGRG